MAADFRPLVAPAPVVWIERPRTGVVDAVCAACEETSGEYIFLFNDESTLDPGALEVLHREAEVSPGRLLSPRQVPGYRFEYFGLPFAAFPFAHRNLLTRLGGLLDPAYRSFYADPDLGMRAHANDVAVVTVEDAVIRHENGHDAVKAQNMRQYMAADQATFRARWGHLGEFRDC